MTEPTYQQAISKSWHIVWHHKILWGLGLLAALLGQFGLGDFFGRVWLILSKGTIGFSWLNLNYDWSGMGWQSILGLVWLVGIVLILSAGLICLLIITQGALISYLAACFKNDRYHDLTKAWHNGASHFWAILGVNLIYRLIFCLLLFSSGILLKLFVNNNNLSILLLLSVSLAVILFFYLLVSIIYIYTLGYAVIDKKKVVDAIILAWRLFSRHVLVSFEVGIVMMFFNLILVIFLVTSLILAFLPSVVVWLVAGLIDMVGVAIFGLLLGLFLWLLIVLWSAAVFNVFNTGVWVYLFMKMHKEGVVSRLVGWAGVLFKKF